MGRTWTQVDCDILPNERIAEALERITDALEKLANA